MRQWSKFTRDEIERRRLASVDTLQIREREEFGRWYQEECDRMYWTRGQCCAGCDHWQSDAALTGQCSASGIVSGADVMRSIGAEFSSYIPAPGFPFTEASFHCGKFKDDFDWGSLQIEYLRKIGAMHQGRTKQKPTHVNQVG